MIFQVNLEGFWSQITQIGSNPGVADVVADELCLMRNQQQLRGYCRAEVAARERGRL